MRNANKLNRDLKNVQPMFEVLEGRTMMSAVPLSVMVHEAHQAAACTAATNISVGAAAKSTKSTLPAVSPDPTVTDSSITYHNFASDPLFSSAGPSQNDINQGDLGDCYFLSVLASVAKVDPNVIRQNVASNGDGTFTVKLFSGGVQKSIRVNADLPTWPDGSLAYAGLGTQNCLWVAIVEKAYAVVRTNSDSYNSLNGGWMSDGFNALGVHNTSVFAESALFNVVKADTKAGDALTYASDDTVSDSAPLIADHAYEIISASFNAKGTPLTLTLRNPWGDGGPAIDGASDDGFITITAQQALVNFSGMVIGLV
jgi:hypothetical protein